MKRFICILICLVLLMPVFSSCDNGYSDSTIITFAEISNPKTLQSLDGKVVSLMGYMASSSPVTGKFIYLMNMPYQTCPFCKPNSSELSNSVIVYAKKSFEYTMSPIMVTGIMKVGKFYDQYGYETDFKIENATYTKVDESSMSEDMRIWNQLASTNIISEVYRMYDYINFTCFWYTYTTKFAGGEDYLYPTDALMYIKEKDSDGNDLQYNYGYKKGYFDSIINEINEVDSTKFAGLAENITKAKKLAEDAVYNLENSDVYYTSTVKYSEYFKEDRSQYEPLSDDLEKRMDECFNEFITWLTTWGS